MMYTPFDFKSDFWYEIYTQTTAQGFKNLDRTEKLRIIEAHLRLCPAAKDDLVLIGFASVMGQVKARALAPHKTAKKIKVRRPVNRKVFIKAYAEEIAKLQDNEIKARSYERVIDILGSEMIGDKCLGDCNRTELLRECGRLENMGRQMTARIMFLREVITMIGDKTAYTCDSRKKIVALLTQYKEDA